MTMNGETLSIKIFFHGQLQEVGQWRGQMDILDIMHLQDQKSQHGVNIYVYGSISVGSWLHFIFFFQTKCLASIKNDKNIMKYIDIEACHLIGLQ